MNLDAISSNVQHLRRHSASRWFMAVVKADGYGHGMVPVARAALAGGADWLAVAMVEEGLKLRKAGIQAPILILTEPPVASLSAALELDLTLPVYSTEFVLALDQEGERRGRSVAVHLKLDTGMNRVGTPRSRWRAIFGTLRDSPHLRVEAIWSHLAVADEPGHPYTDDQLALFEEGLIMARQYGLHPDMIHLCNSAGTLSLPDHHYDMIRPGLAIYGVFPTAEFRGLVRLQPALTLRSSVSYVKPLKRGEVVGYGLRWQAQRDTLLATIPMGYADGLTRGLSNKGSVLVRGRRAPIAGTISMDQFCVDAGDLEISRDEPVVLIGSQGREQLSVDEWAELTDTISYEVLTGIGPRVPRTYASSDSALMGPIEESAS